MRSHEISDIWTRPSTPSTLTKIPKSTTPVTLPLTLSPMANLSRTLLISFLWAAFSEKISLFSRSSASRTTTLIGLPISSESRAWISSLSLTRGYFSVESCETGKNPRTPSSSMSSPPLFASIGDRDTSSWSLAILASTLQAFSLEARFIERIA